MRQVLGWNFPDADEAMARDLSADGTYQADHLSAALTYVTDWSLAIDGGAHVGTWSKVLASRFEQVIAVEPSPDTFEALQANLAAFGCANVTAKQIALGAKPGTVRLTLDPTEAAKKNTGARYVVEHGAIPRETIDDWNLPSLGFLKLDVEGSEPLALMGATATLTRCRPIVLYENKNFWRRYGFPPDAVERLLTAAGYRRLVRAGTDLIWGPA